MSLASFLRPPTFGRARWQDLLFCWNWNFAILACPGKTDLGITSVMGVGLRDRNWESVCCLYPGTASHSGIGIICFYYHIGKIYLQQQVLNVRRMIEEESERWAFKVFSVFSVLCWHRSLTHCAILRLKETTPIKVAPLDGEIFSRSKHLNLTPCSQSSPSPSYLGRSETFPRWKQSTAQNHKKKPFPREVPHVVKTDDDVVYNLENLHK